jgi:hypothetical protein
MFSPLRSPTACLLLAFYSLAAVLGEGLHDWTCPDHGQTAAAHAHDAPGAPAATRVVEAAGEAGHDPQQCPICQYRAQGQLSLANDDVEFNSALCLNVSAEPSSPSLRRVQRPYGPRAPPPVHVTVV